MTKSVEWWQQHKVQRWVVRLAWDIYLRFRYYVLRKGANT